MYIHMHMYTRNKYKYRYQRVEMYKFYLNVYKIKSMYTKKGRVGQVRLYLRFVRFELGGFFKKMKTRAIGFWRVLDYYDTQNFKLI